MSEHQDAIVVGMGPGGELVASRLLAAQWRVTVVERELVGGECAYWACIPAKTLLRGPHARAEADLAPGTGRPGLDWPSLREYRDQMVRHLDDAAQIQQYEQQGATVIKGEARIVGRDPWRVRVDDQELTADHVIVATGSAPVRPPITGLGGVPVWTNRETTGLTEIPPRALVVGGSAVGVELGQFLARMGSSVTIVERGPQLMGREEPRVGELTAAALRANGVRVHVDSQVATVSGDGRTGAAVELSDGTRVTTDVVVLGSGRRPRTDELGLTELGIDPDEHGALPVDERCRVTSDGLWAIGDVTGVALFTHVAKYQARVVADVLLGRERVADYTAVPRVVFADPEIAAVGLTHAQAQEHGLDVTAAEVDLTATGARPWTYQTDPVGNLGLLIDRRDQVLVGAWAVAPLAAEWIHQAALAIRARIPLSTLRDTITQFPTYSEGYLAALESAEV